MPDRPQACPQCHHVNRGASFCEQCGRELPGTDACADLWLLRFTVRLLPFLIFAGGAATIGVSIEIMPEDVLAAGVVLLKGGIAVFVAVVHRELLKLVIEVRERV